MLDGTLAVTPAVLRLLSLVCEFAISLHKLVLEFEARTSAAVADSGSDATLSSVLLPVAVLQNLLYYVALSDSRDSRVVAMQQEFRLGEWLPSRGSLAHAREALNGQRSWLSDAIVDNLAAEVGQVHRFIERFADFGLLDNAELEACVELSLIHI